MLEEARLFEDSERCPIDRALIDAVALPAGDRYEDGLFAGYFADYAGVAGKYRPKRIYEIGVRYGYIAICMMLGLQRREAEPVAEYVGIDDESYHYGSCGRANANFAQVLPGWPMRALKFNSFNGVPPGIGTFDLCHVDGHHAHHAVMLDLASCWSILNPGGIIIVDDARPVDDQGRPAEIYGACMDFLAQFAATPETVTWQYQGNERGHVYIRKGAAG